MPDYKELGLDQNMRALSSLSNSAYLTDRDFKQYIDDRVRNIRKPGGLDFQAVKNTSLGYQAVVGKDNTGGAFTDIQDAINYIDSIGGGNVFIKSGTYDISSPVVINGDNIRIIGEGKDTTVVKISNNCGTLFDINANNITFNNLTFDGDRDNQGSTQVLIGYYNDVGGTYKGLAITNSTFRNQNGVSGDCVGAGPTVEHISISDSEFQNNDGNAINATTADKSMYVNLTINNCRSGVGLGGLSSAINCYVDSCEVGYISSSQGFNVVACFGTNCGTTYYMVGVGGAIVSSASIFGSIGAYIRDNVRIENCYFEGGTVGGTSIIIDGIESSFIGNFIERNVASSGLQLLDNSNCVVSNNIFSLTGEGSITQGDSSSAILMGTISSRHIISNNRIDGDNGTYVTSYGIREAGTNTNHNLIIGNIITGAGTPIGTQGANTLVIGNITS